MRYGTENKTVILHGGIYSLMMHRISAVYAGKVSEAENLDCVATVP